MRPAITSTSSTSLHDQEFALDDALHLLSCPATPWWSDEAEPVRCIPWHHASRMVEPLLVEIERFIDAHSHATRVVILQETIGLTWEEKAEFSRLENAIVNDPDPPYPGTLEYRMLQGFSVRDRTLLEGLRSLRVNHPHLDTLELRYIDIASPQELSDQARAHGACARADRSLARFLGGRGILTEMQSFFREPDLSLSAQYLERYRASLEAAAGVTSAHRNAVMFEQILNALDSLPHGAILAVLFGSSHSEIAFRLESSRSSDTRFVILPAVLISRLPESSRFSHPGPLQDILEMKVTAGAALSDTELMQGAFEYALLGYLKRRIGELPREQRVGIVADDASCEFIARTVVLMTSQEEIGEYFARVDEPEGRRRFETVRRYMERLLEEWLHSTATRWDVAWNGEVDALLSLILERYLTTEE